MLMHEKTLDKNIILTTSLVSYETKSKTNWDFTLFTNLFLTMVNTSLQFIKYSKNLTKGDVSEKLLDNDLIEAQKKIKLAEDTSDIQTEKEEDKPPKKFANYDDSDGSGNKNIQQNRNLKSNNIKITVLNILLTIQEQNKQILANLKKNFSPPQTKSPNLPVLLPIDAFKQLEKLKKDLEVEENFKKLSTYMFLIGKKDLVSKVNGVLKKLISNGVANYFNLYGKREKRPFKNLRMNAVVLRYSDSVSFLISDDCDEDKSGQDGKTAVNTSTPTRGIGSVLNSASVDKNTGYNAVVRTNNFTMILFQFTNGVLNFRESRKKTIDIDSNSSVEMECTPPEVCETEKNNSLNLLPTKSRHKYKFSYIQFMHWQNKKGIKSSFSENVLKAGIGELS
ncbi:hypothetical protein RN001_001082 [Aquatica leii]|uniref:DUF4806 domain-containing protein n=1 Tax=Aquatica leii TaxID=1421715 RepID=A0AAN7PN36_9COLE|nr:hypothetical protein RN001_001082 [Aquatica leii]